MTITSRVTLVAAFETGDKPGGSDYENWIDSFVHLTDTSAQAISSPVTFNASAHFQTIAAQDISASGINAALFTGGRVVCSAVSALSHVTTGRVIVCAVSANSVWADRLEVGSAVISSGTFTDVSAEHIFVDNLSVGSSITTSGLATFLTVSAPTVHVIDYSVHTTVRASAGNASAVPATAAGYIPIVISGVQYRLVLYNPSN